jgi:hypothetical protein
LTGWTNRSIGDQAVKGIVPAQTPGTAVRHINLAADITPANRLDLKCALITALIVCWACPVKVPPRQNRI